MNPESSSVSPTFDFSPLQQPLSDADLAAYRSLNNKDGKAKKALWIIIFSVLALPTLFAMLSSNINDMQHGDFSVLFFMGVWLAVVGGVIYVISLLINAAEKRKARLYSFAIRNHLTFINEQADPGYAGMIFDEGHSRSISAGYVFPQQTEIGNYTYITGSGKNSETHEWGYVKVKMPRKLPNMVLDAKSNNVFGKFTNLPDTFRKDQVLSLEGDFNDHFTLYAPKEYERDALYVFTPDVMAKLIDYGGGFDMEVVEDELFIYKSGKFDLSSQTELTNLLSIVESIGSELREQTDQYADEQVGDRTQNIVAPQGMRLKHGINWIAVIIVIAFLAFNFLPAILGFIAGLYNGL